MKGVKKFVTVLLAAVTFVTAAGAATQTNAQTSDGTSTITFSPHSVLTRTQLVAYLYNTEKAA